MSSNRYATFKLEKRLTKRTKNDNNGWGKRGEKIWENL